MGLDNLPSASWEVNCGWMLAANLASDLDAWVRLLALHDIKGLAHAEPDTMRFRLYHLLARLADHARRPRPPPMAARRCELAVGRSVRHQLATAHRPRGCHLTAGHCPDKDQEGETGALRARGTRRTRGDTRRTFLKRQRTLRANR
jgi:hypothetical protein